MPDFRARAPCYPRPWGFQPHHQARMFSYGDTMRCRRRADSKYHRNLWEVACARLTEDEQKTLQAGLELPFEFDELRITIDNTRRRAESKWKVKGLHGREIDLHTHFDKIVVWIQRFVAIGDIIDSSTQHTPLCLGQRCVSCSRYSPSIFSV